MKQKGHKIAVNNHNAVSAGAHGSWAPGLCDKTEKMPTLFPGLFPLLRGREKVLGTRTQTQVRITDLSPGPESGLVLLWVVILEMGNAKHITLSYIAPLSTKLHV